jgi:hypothetical protein
MSLSANQNRLVFMSLAIAFLAVSPTARAVIPAPDGGYPGANTAEGTNALFSRTTGLYDTALGYYALYSDTSASYNTAVGAFALRSTTTGNYNTATGYQALYFNTNGFVNTASGYQALLHNTTGRGNTANGAQALLANTGGFDNTALGSYALYTNTTGANNTASGHSAILNNTSGKKNTASGAYVMQNNTIGSNNVAAGCEALFNNTNGFNNTAIGFGALSGNTSGTGNIAVGYSAAEFITTGNNNIVIGSFGTTNESATIRIGQAQTRTFIAGIRGRITANANAVPVVIDSEGQLGTVSSSRRFKDGIQPMDKASDSILALKPVTFHYKSDSQNTPQFGLIAEEVAKVNPDLVVSDDKGEIYTVRYDAVNAMLLNEFLKQHRKVKEQDQRSQEQEAKIAQQQQDIKALTTALKEQAAQIGKVSAELALSKNARQVVENNR